MRRPDLIVALLLLAAAPAQAEDTAALMARAPWVVTDGPVTPFAGPVTIGGTGWGSFRRLCVAHGALREDGREAEIGSPTCFDVAAAREEAGTWHLTLLTEARGTAPPIVFTTTRDAGGRVGAVAVIPPAGVAPPSPEQRQQMGLVFRTALRANGIEQTVVPASGHFVMPLPLGDVGRDFAVDGGGLDCRATGEAQIVGRRALLADCTGQIGGPGQRIAMTLAGHFAIDVETGMVLRHGYASDLVVEADAASRTPRVALRGVSRLRLE